MQQLAIKQSNITLSLANNRTLRHCTSQWPKPTGNSRNRETNKQLGKLWITYSAGEVEA